MSSQGLTADPTKPTTFSAVFKHISAPTAVDNCLYCHLIHPKLKNLVVTRGCFIDLFSLKQGFNNEMHLNWLTTTCVYDEIVNIISVRFIGDKLDTLLISFSEAKIAVMGFDPVQYELKTLSLHNYEFDNLKFGRTQFSRPPILRVDPLHRCAVLLVYDRHLAVLPFRRSETLAAGDKYFSKPLGSTKSGLSWERRATAPLLATFTTCLSSSTGEKINNVIDMQFLHGFYEPTLLVLYEPIGTWVGRVSARRDTCCIVALSFNLQKRTNPVIWFQESLPFDCHSVYSVPQPIGGVIVLATNSVIYMKQTLPSCGLPLNCYAQVTTNFPMRQDIPDCGPMTLDGCRALVISDSQFLIATRTGKLCLLSLWVEQATQTVSSLLFHEIGLAVPPYCMTLLDSGYIFIGSRLCDSVLMRYEISSTRVNTMGRLIATEDSDCWSRVNDIPMINGSAEVNNPENRKTAEQSSLDEQETLVANNPNISIYASYTFDEVDVQLYGENILNPPSSYREIIMYSFKVVDRLVNFGPIGSLTTGEVPCLAPGNTDPTDEALTAAQTDMHHIELIACIPRSIENVTNPHDLRAGGVLLLHTSVRPRGLTAFELPEYMSLWSLYGPPIVTPLPSKEHNDDSKQQVEPATTDGAAHEAMHLLSEVLNRINTESTCTTASSCPSNADSTVIVSEQLPDSSKVDDQSCQIADKQELRDLIVSNSDEPNSATLTGAKLKKCTGPMHSYLLLTREDSTMILEVNHEIVELEVSGFNTTEMTVTAVNLGSEYIAASRNTPNNVSGVNNSFMECDNSTVGLHTTFEADSVLPKKLRAGHDYPYILQVSPTSLRLLDGPKLVEYIQVTLEWRIHLASCADPYVLLCTEDDELFLVRLRPTSTTETSAASRLLPKKPLFLDLRPALETFNHELNDGITPFASSLHLEFFHPKVDQVSAPLCFCLYHDRAGLLSQWLWRKRPTAHSERIQSNRNASMMGQFPYTKNMFFPVPDSATYAQMHDVVVPHISTSDEEDMLLYGELIDVCKRERAEHLPSFLSTPGSVEAEVEMEEERPENGKTFDKSTYYAFILFSNGVLEIYSLPEFTLLYEVHHFSDLPTMLVDHRSQSATPKCGTVCTAPSMDEENMPPTVLEIAVFSIGRNRDRPVLMARTSQEVAFFEALCSAPGDVQSLISGSWNQEGLRWRRLPIPCPLFAPRRVRTDPKIADVQSTLLTRMHMLRPFEDIDGHRGVFVCGGTPMWLFSTDTGHIRVFNHSIDGIMGSFAPLNTHICPSGFVYFTYSNEMRLATLPPGYSFQQNLGMHWIPMELTPYFVQYHVENKIYALVGTQSKPCSSVYHLNAEGNKEEEQLFRPPSCVLPPLDHYVLQMFAPSIHSTWQPIPNARIEFEDWEVVTCLITAQLASEQTFHGTKDYLAVAANMSYGEEIPVRGRIVIMDVIDVVPEPGQPLTRHKLKTIYDGDQKGPVTAMTSCQGHLISAIGQKIYIWTLKNADLVGVAFVDSELYIHSLLCVKNLVLAADVLKSIQVLRFQPDLRVLSVVSRDNIAREVYTANFFVDGRRLGFLVSDDHGNVVIYSYDPLDPTSRSGRRLVRRADVRLPSRATCSLRVANRFRHALLSVKPSAPPPPPPPPQMNVVATGDEGSQSHTPSSSTNITSGMGSQKQSVPTHPQTVTLNASIDPERLKHSVYLGTPSGALLLLGPLRDKMYSRLRITEKNLIHQFGPTCGTLPKLCWGYRSTFPELANPCGQVADADLLWRFLVLPHSQRLEIAKKSGQSLDGIMDDVADLNATTVHF